MYIWTAISFEDQLAKLRQQAACISEDLDLDNPSLTLPIHTSLTISFEIADEMYDRIITDLSNYFSSIAPFSVYPETIERNGHIIWLKMKQSPELAELHTHLIDLLNHRYGVEPHPFDLDFKFHATLFFGDGDHALDTAFSLIKAAPLPDVLTARKFVIGTSPTGLPGTYRVCREIFPVDHTLSRIRQMEERLDTVTESVQSLSDALDAYIVIQPQLQELIRYYESPQWLADYDADSTGLLPPDLKRGVLSQDTVYNLLTENQRLLDVMNQLTKEIEES